ncbi:MAG: anion permease [Acidobacteria bacterium]|nr:anion permease [Acidobacteriota bacterium]
MGTTAVAASEVKPEVVGWTKLGGAAFGILAAIALWFAPLSIEPKAQHALAIAALLIAFWITEVLPHAVTGLLGCWLFWTLGVVPSRVALGGFSSDAPWFLLGALFIGAMATPHAIWPNGWPVPMFLRVWASFLRVLMAFIPTDAVRNREFGNSG